jgi:import inner membrane translocase subunit TIM50
VCILEEKKEQDKQWKRMKLSFYFFSLSMGGMGIWSLYELAQPEKDSEGKDIDDEFSHLPTMEQYKSRILKSLNYYQRVTKNINHNLNLCYKSI